jgi:hypothetical protein
MEHKSIPYSVFECAGGVFRWTVSLATGNRAGQARSRPMAILQAIKAIDKERRQAKAARRGSALLSAQSKIGTSEL